VTWLLDDKPLQSVLVTRLRYLGDVVMSTVVLRALRDGDPDLKLGYLCEDAYAPVLEGHPDLHRLHRLGSRRRGPDAAARGAGGGGGDSFSAMVSRLSSARYDLAVDLFFNPRSAVLLRAAGIPARIGGARSWRRRLYTHTVVPENLPGAPDGWRDVAPGGLGDHLCRLAPLVHRESGRMFLDRLVEMGASGPLLPELAVGSAAGLELPALAAAGIEPGDEYLVLVPGATWPAKEWPLGRWLELLQRLHRERPEKIAVLTPLGGGAAWKELGDHIPAGRGGVLPPLALARVMGLLDGAKGVVGMDGGIMHTAVALGTPTVALFGPTEPEIWFPYGHDPRFRVLAHSPPCHPCHLHVCRAFSCLPAVRPDEVTAALADVLSAAAVQERTVGNGVQTRRKPNGPQSREGNQ